MPAPRLAEEPIHPNDDHPADDMLHADEPMHAEPRMHAGDRRRAPGDMKVDQPLQAYRTAASPRTAAQDPLPAPEPAKRTGATASAGPAYQGNDARTRAQFDASPAVRMPDRAPDRTQARTPAHTSERTSARAPDSAPDSAPGGMPTGAPERAPVDAPAVAPGVRRSVDIDVGGMTCASCVGRVERALKKVDGIDEASVNLATERARIAWHEGTGTNSEAVVEQALGAVRKAGYDASLHAAATRPTTRSGVVATDAGGFGDAAGRVVDPADVSHPDRDQAAGAANRAIGAPAEPGPPRAPTDPGRIELSGRQVLAICCVLSLPLVAPMLLAPFGMHLMPPPGLQFSLATAVLLLGGMRFYRAAWSAVRAASGNMELLVVLGTTAAWALSTWLWLGRDAGAHALYFESAAVVVTLVLLGKHLEYRAKRSTLAALDALSNLQPAFATRLDGERESVVPIEALAVSDRLAIRPGERVPADARIVEGASSVDESMLTGESMPVARHEGDTVTGGSINGEGRLIVEVTRVGTESTLARIVRLIEDTQAKKPPIQRLVDRVAAVFVPAVLLIAAATLGFWLWRGVGIETAMIHAVAVLVIACPCALGLATPAAIMAGTGSAARAGILIRDPAALETAHQVRVVAFDKTGTLTEGHPTLRAVEPAPGVDPSALVAVAAAIQAGSEHPLAGAVIRHAEAEGIVALRAVGIRAINGAGVEGRIEVPGTGAAAHTSRIVIGSEQLMIREAVETQPLATRAAELQRDGMTVAWVAMSEGEDAPEPDAGRPTLLGLLAFADTARETSAEAIRMLHAAGIETVILSGDNPQAVRMVGQKLGVREAVGGLLPEGKVAWIERARAGGAAGTTRAIAMVGDGINDAPALASADLGIAMGDGSDVAMQTAPITLMRSDPRLVPGAIDIGRRTRANLRQNLFWAFAYNVVGIPLAAAGLLSPVVAGAAMAASSICVLGNALRLTRWKPGSSTPSHGARPDRQA